MCPETDFRKKNYDIDLDFGKVGESKVLDMFEGDGSIEVKTERDTWKRTGNIAIEIRCHRIPSGISTTNASTWIHLLSYNGKIEGGFLFKVKNLKKRIKQLLKNKIARKTFGGDGDNSELVLLPIKEIFEISKM